MGDNPMGYYTVQLVESLVSCVIICQIIAFVAHGAQ